MSKVEKKDGAIMDCGSCGLRLICKNKTYPAYEDHAARTVLQWQNEKGRAHYKWIGPDKFKCVDEKGVDIPGKDTTTSSNTVNSGDEAGTLPKENPTNNAKSKPTTHENLDDATSLLITNDIKLMYLIRKSVLNVVEGFENEPHMGMVWQMTEKIWDKYFGERNHV